MSKPKAPSRQASNEARSVARMLRVSPRKLNLVAQSIRGLHVQKALNELAFSPKRIAADVHKALRSAIANAENNHGLDIDQLVVSQAYVGKNLVLKRMHARAKGRGNRIVKRTSHITVTVAER